MIVEIHGAGFQNKGAELMLRTAVCELKERLPDCALAIDPCYGPHSSRLALGLLQILPARSHVGSARFSRRFWRQRLFAQLQGEKLFKHVAGVGLSDYACVSLGMVEGLIDIAGFTYTDQWGSQPSKDFAKLTGYYRSRGKPVVLLPQAFGPFQGEETRTAFRKIGENASLIFARDEKSYEYVTELVSSKNKVMQAPDVTLFYPGYSDGEPDVHSEYACVVPNVRMIEQGKSEWSGKYETWLMLIVRELVQQGIPVRILVHDTSGGDLGIAHGIAESVNSSYATVVEEDDPVALKEFIGGALMLVGSRYHSMVAALSQKVPVIALGWAHKYETLLEDFGCEELLVSSETPVEAVLGLVRQLVDEEENLTYRHRIGERLQSMYQANRNMWDRVTHVLASNLDR